jgi:rsbT co-antagonist protein RsbR
MSKLAEIISRNEEGIRTDWLNNMSKSVQRTDLMSKTEREEQSRALLSALVKGVKSDESADLAGPGWSDAKDLLREISASRARQGFSPAETASFVLSLKQPLFTTLRKELGGNQDELFNAIWTSTQLLDRLSMLTAEAFMATREELISRQQQELMELSTPVVKLWDGILALPVIGTLDSARTQVVMENLLQTVVATNSKYAIIDITGVPTVDTLVAQHLLKTITAARLMGAECIISGVRPQIAQTIVHLGINLEDVITKARLSDAFALALHRSGKMVVRRTPEAGQTSGSIPSARES